MGRLAGVPIEPKEQTTILDATMALPGVLMAGVPGGTGSARRMPLTVGGMRSLTFMLVFATMLQRAGTTRSSSLRYISRHCLGWRSSGSPGQRLTQTPCTSPSLDAIAEL